MSNLQEFYEIQFVQSPWRPVNFAYLVYDQFGCVAREVYGTIMPKDVSKLGRYGLPAMQEAFTRWLYEEGHVSKENNETVSVNVFPWAGLRVANVDLFLHRSIGTISIAKGTTLNTSKGLSTLRKTTPYGVAKMGAELGLLHALYDRGQARHHRQRFIEKWASEFDTDPRSDLTVEQGLEAAANFFDVPYKRIQNPDGYTLITVNDSREDYFPMLRVRVSATDGYHYCYRVNSDHSEQTEVFSQNEVQRVIDWVRGHMEAAPEKTYIQRRAIARHSLSRDIFQGTCDRLFEEVPDFYETYMQGANEFIIRRPKTLSAPQLLGTLSFCLDEDENPYLTWVVSSVVLHEETVTHHLQMRNKSDHKEFVVEILQSIKAI